LGYDVDTLGRAIDFARKTPDAIPLIRNDRPFLLLVPSHHIHKTGIDAGLAAGTLIEMNLNVGTHAPSELN
jgi:hypothetical protein